MARNMELHTSREMILLGSLVPCRISSRNDCRSRSKVIRVVKFLFPVVRFSNMFFKGIYIMCHSERSQES